MTRATASIALGELATTYARALDGTRAVLARSEPVRLAGGWELNPPHAAAHLLEDATTHLGIVTGPPHARAAVLELHADLKLLRQRLLRAGHPESDGGRAARAAANAVSMTETAAASARRLSGDATRRADTVRIRPDALASLRAAAQFAPPPQASTATRRPGVRIPDMTQWFRDTPTSRAPEQTRAMTAEEQYTAAMMQYHGYHERAGTSGPSSVPTPPPRDVGGMWLAHEVPWEILQQMQ